jgi:HD superfamily phosphohydrolase
MSAKIFRDPLYNYIRIERDRDGWLLELLDCAEVQRLRRIHQLGLSYLTYPGAAHNRLSHTLGVLHLMQGALEHLEVSHHDARLDEARQPLLAAALAHDVGHGPFSHVFEPCLGTNHEKWSCAVVRSPDSEVHRVLRTVDGQLPERVAALIEKGNRRAPAWQRNLLSSQLDVDRLDYLRRDSLFTGVDFGRFDWYRLLHTLALHDRGGERELVWAEKAKYAVEEYIFARFYMYQNVYLHKTTRGFERLLHALWARARRLRAEGGDVRLLAPLAAFWDADAPAPDGYLAVEEFTVMFQIQEWSAHPDRALSDLARRFLARRGFAAIEAPRPRNELDGDLADWEEALRGLVAARGYEPPELYALRDDLQTRIYEAYFPEKESEEQAPPNAIHLLPEGGSEPVEISELLPRLETVTNRPVHQLRYYVPKELRRDAEALRRRWEA